VATRDQDLFRSRIDSLQIALVTFPGSLPEHRNPVTLFTTQLLRNPSHVPDATHQGLELGIRILEPIGRPDAVTMFELVLYGIGYA
jgi:hypothetical protein